jgi:hypothetical protein
VAKRVSHKESAAQTGDEGVFAIDLARVTAAGFMATTLGTSVFKTESLEQSWNPLNHCYADHADGSTYGITGRHRLALFEWNRVCRHLCKNTHCFTETKHSDDRRVAWPCAMGCPHAHSADSIQRGPAGSVRSTAKSRDVPFTYIQVWDGRRRFSFCWIIWFMDSLWV